VAWFAGRFAQRQGYFQALKVGYVIMIVGLSLGAVTGSAMGHVGVMVLTVVGMSFTWPTLEALVSEGEPRSGLQHMVGLYNVVWAGTAALANFSGGAMLQKLGLTSLFFVPIAIHVAQLGLTLWLEHKAGESLHKIGPNDRARTPHGTPVARGGGGNPGSEGNGSEAIREQGSSAQITVPGPIIAAAVFVPNVAASAVRETSVPVHKAKKFLRMAWVANPFAYIAINTLIAVAPGVAQRLELSTMAAGFCCSVWCFSRLGAFALLWQWEAWHYRFRWLLLAYIGLLVSFGATVLAPNVAVLVVAQLVFGAAVGLIYYSSLFYSMDRSETKGEHGGIHEAVIGLGNCAGPAVGALALRLVPGNSQSGALAVIALLLCGLGALLRIWKREPGA
jgi:predicted MFS family arabinose efflux permease